MSYLEILLEWLLEIDGFHKTLLLHYHCHYLFLSNNSKIKDLNEIFLYQLLIFLSTHQQDINEECFSFNTTFNLVIIEILKELQ